MILGSVPHWRRSHDRPPAAGRPVVAARREGADDRTGGGLRPVDRRRPWRDRVSFPAAVGRQRLRLLDRRSSGTLRARAIRTLALHTAVARIRSRAPGGRDVCARRPRGADDCAAAVRSRTILDGDAIDGTPERAATARAHRTGRGHRPARVRARIDRAGAGPSEAAGSARESPAGTGRHARRPRDIRPAGPPPSVA